VLLGFCFVLCARDRVRADGPFAAPAFALVATFVGVVLVPVGLYLYLAHPAWTWMYLIDPAKVPSLALVPVLVVLGGVLIAAWYVGARLLAADKQLLLIYAVVLTLGLLVSMAVALRDRVFHYGTYEDYKRSIALDLMDVKLGYVLVALLLGIGAAAALGAFELSRDARRVSAR
jgi:hypothetical protein